MTLFEYLSVAYSIVLSLAGVRLLGGLSVSFATGTRCWLYIAWLGMSLLIAAIVWWNFWSYRDVEWNFFFFLLVLLLPGAVYLMAVALVPDQPGKVTSWEDHFWAARGRFFAAVGLFFAVIAVNTWLLLDLPLLHPIRAVQMFGLGLAVAGGFTTDRRLHAGVAIAFLLLELAAAALSFSPAGSLTVRT